MPKYVVRQPNGLLANFSTVVDDFTDYDMTEAEALQSWRHIGEADARVKVRRGVEDDCAGVCRKTADDGLNRWRHAIHTVRVVHGDPVAEERERLMGGQAP